MQAPLITNSNRAGADLQPIVSPTAEGALQFQTTPHERKAVTIIDGAVDAQS